MYECKETPPISFFHKFISKKKYKREKQVCHDKTLELQQIIDGLRNYVQCVNKGRHFVTDEATETCVSFSRLDFMC